MKRIDNALGQTRRRLLFSLAILFFAAPCTILSQQLDPIQNLLFGIPQGPPVDELKQVRGPRSLRELVSGSDAGSSDTRRCWRNGDLQRFHQELGGQMEPGSVQNTIPVWEDSFTYQGLEFKYKMVGTDPKKGSQTTVIPTVIIPLRFVFADGQVYDASADIVDGNNAIQAIINSPIFQSHDYVLSGTDVGNTQYGDAFQRANFWNAVSTRSRDYHVLLGDPDVTPVQTINVPPGKFGYLIDPVNHQRFPIVQ